MKIRYANTNDVPTLAILGRRIHAETRFAAFDYSTLRVTENLYDIIELGQNERGTNCLLIAEDERGSIAGVLIGVIERHLFSDLPVASVMVYYVFPEKRMSGAGFKLISAFRRWAENRSAFEICVGINSATQLERSDRLLTRIGFERTGGNYSLQSGGKKRCQQPMSQEG
ncbi:GNAT family N-acetyltransferase [Lacisediminimonas sp.]|uniref:GNAT family N-acetyltransferase n=1 Tax=Lacisediminimonas sp. TaxID=3060582 RepID=UPI00271E52AA|nr:GNAT family N-acetyltransferase [Lacisediminimonas sp.]MDO8300473.1 GNAT family N-acetyltransferase [Lacisediminimonas sp.]